jgi:hypothetical protein
MRRRWPVIALILLTAACGDRRTFNAQYDETANTISERARAIDANLAQEEAERNGQR